MIFSLSRRGGMKKWKSDTPHKLQEGGVPPVHPSVDPTLSPGVSGGAPTPPPPTGNAAGIAAGNAAIANIGNTKEPSGPAPLETAIDTAKAVGIKRTGGIAPGKFLRQGGTTGRKLL